MGGKQGRFLCLSFSLHQEPQSSEIARLKNKEKISEEECLRFSSSFKVYEHTYICLIIILVNTHRHIHTYMEERDRETDKETKRDR